MNIGSLRAEDFAEESLLSHIQCSELKEVIDAVLQHHTVTLGTLGGIDDIPGFLESHHGGHFAGYVLPLVHRIDHHLSMVSPVGSDVDEVDIVTIAECLPGILLTAIARSLGEASLGEDLLSLLHTLWVEVTEGLDLYPVEVGEALHSTWATHPETDEAYTDDRYRSMS